MFKPYLWDGLWADGVKSLDQLEHGPGETSLLEDLSLPAQIPDTSGPVLIPLSDPLSFGPLSSGPLPGPWGI